MIFRRDPLALVKVASLQCPLRSPRSRTSDQLHGLSPSPISRLTYLTTIRCCCNWFSFAASPDPAPRRPGRVSSPCSHWPWPAPDAVRHPPAAAPATRRAPRRRRRRLRRRPPAIRPLGPAAAESCPARVYAGMTEAQRVGQLFIVGIAGDPNSVIAPAVATYHFGSLLFASTNTAGVSALLAMSQPVQSMATARATAKTRLLHRRQPGGRRGPAAPGSWLCHDSVGGRAGPTVPGDAAEAGCLLGPSS